MKNLFLLAAYNVFEMKTIRYICVLKRKCKDMEVRQKHAGTSTALHAFKNDITSKIKYHQIYDRNEKQ